MIRNQPALHKWDVRLLLSLMWTSISAPRETEVNLISISVVSYSRYVSAVSFCLSCSLVFLCFAKRFRKSTELGGDWWFRGSAAGCFECFSVCFLSPRCILHPYEPCAATVAEKTIDRWKLAVAVHTHKVHISSFPVPLQKPCWVHYSLPKGVNTTYASSKLSIWFSYLIDTSPMLSPACWCETVLTQRWSSASS